MNITQFTMEEVRCFAERQEFNIRPLTFLVGENSTGKTTSLACFQVLADYLRGEPIDFNSDPYLMGIFKDIVRNSRKKEKAFTLGFTFRGKNEDVEYTVECVEKKDGVEPAIGSVIIKFADGEISLSPDNKLAYVHLASFDEERNQYRIDVNSDILDRAFPFSLLEGVILGGERQSKGDKALANYLQGKREDWNDPWWRLRSYPWRRMKDGLSAVFSKEPTRSCPKRTYDPTRVFDDPGGNYVFTLLMEIKATQKKRWETLKGQLVEFGKSSGLFQDIDVKILGGSMGNPFQLRVKVRGPNSNIVDVGYGVSQILPILVHVLNLDVAKHQMTYSLLQQPEVHLHPMAQAAFSSLLATKASQGKRTFIVETHSDYMIDRARIEIRKGNIRPEDVSLIYFEPKRNVVEVHNISFDKMGNMEGVPQHYREFFMTEYRRLMGFEE